MPPKKSKKVVVLPKSKKGKGDKKKVEGRYITRNKDLAKKRVDHLNDSGEHYLLLRYDRKDGCVK